MSLITDLRKSYLAKASSHSLPSQGPNETTVALRERSVARWRRWHDIVQTFGEDIDDADTDSLEAEPLKPSAEQETIGELIFIVSGQTGCVRIFQRADSADLYLESSDDSERQSHDSATVPVDSEPCSGPEDQLRAINALMQRYLGEK